MVCAGQELHVTCCVSGAQADNHLLLFRDGQNLGSNTASWNFKVHAQCSEGLHFSTFILHGTMLDFPNAGVSN